MQRSARLQQLQLASSPAKKLGHMTLAEQVALLLPAVYSIDASRTRPHHPLRLSNGN
jgi:hypothetical protein